MTKRSLHLETAHHLAQLFCATRTLGIWEITTLGTFWQNLGYALRLLGKNPGLAVVAILSLALGMGANTAISPLRNALLLRDLPVGQPQCLVRA
jgi:hypothetical protein